MQTRSVCKAILPIRMLTKNHPRTLPDYRLLRVKDHFIECRKEALWKITDTIRDEAIQDLKTAVNNFLNAVSPRCSELFSRQDRWGKNLEIRVTKLHSAGARFD